MNVWHIVTLGLVLAFLWLWFNWNSTGVKAAPLNPSGYTYPSSPGA
jgi:hypothetical protein